MNKELNEDARTKQDLLYECSSLKSMLSAAIVKNEQLQQENKKQKEVIDKAIEYINGNKDKYYQDWGQDDGGNDIYLGEYEIKELLDILKEVSE